jgi:FtsP/CotA-like multicopper oxidase with cupredoxin domain
MLNWITRPMTRRGALGAAAALGAMGISGNNRIAAQEHGGHGQVAQAAAPAAPATAEPSPDPTISHEAHYGNRVVGSVDHARNGFDPAAIVTDFDFGEVKTDPDGRTVREWILTAVDKEVEIAPGIFFPAWTFNGRIPGPTLRCVEGERLRMIFQNGSTHPHSMHFHGIHPARMDGVPGAGVINPGEEFTYEFDARPFGCHLYHCHALPLKRHIHKGMYGAFIVDPDPERHPLERAAALGRRHGTPENAGWQEFIMVMNAFDTNFDDENEFYCINTIPFAYFDKPIRIERSRPVRVYLVNVTEFDPVNSLHLHANFFDYYDHGTTLTPTSRIIDTVMQCQAQRGILEFSFADFEPGLYMFHAHQSEFAELGWMSHFEVV